MTKQIDKIENAVLDILKILEGQFTGETEIISRINGHINCLYNNSPAPVIDERIDRLEEGFSELIKMLLRSMDIEFTEVNNQRLEQILNSIDSNFPVSVIDKKASDAVIGDALNAEEDEMVDDAKKPAPVSDEEWTLKECYPPSACRRLLYNDKFIGHVDADTIGPFRTLIDKAAIADEMYYWFKEHRKSHPHHPNLLYDARNTLIQKYEALK